MNLSLANIKKKFDEEARLKAEEEAKKKKALQPKLTAQQMIEGNWNMMTSSRQAYKDPGAAASSAAGNNAQNAAATQAQRDRQLYIKSQELGEKQFERSLSQTDRDRVIQERSKSGGGLGGTMNPVLDAGIQNFSKPGAAPGAVSTTAITNANYGRPDTATEGSSSVTDDQLKSSDFTGTTPIDDPNRKPMTDQLARMIMSQMSGNASNAVLNAQRSGGDMIARAAGDAMGQIASDSLNRGGYGQGAGVQAQMAQNEANMKGISEFAGKMADVRSAEQQDAMAKGQEFLQYSLGQDQMNIEKSRNAQEWYTKLIASNPSLAAEIRNSELGKLWGIDYSKEEQNADTQANKVATQQNRVQAALTAVGEDKGALHQTFEIMPDGFSVRDRTTGEVLDPVVSSALSTMLRTNLPGIAPDENGLPSVKDFNYLQQNINIAWSRNDSGMLKAYGDSRALDVTNFSERSGREAYSDPKALIKIGALRSDLTVKPNSYVVVDGEVRKLVAFTKKDAGYMATYITPDGTTKIERII